MSDTFKLFATSETPREASMKRHPAGKKLKQREKSVLEGLKYNGLTALKSDLDLAIFEEEQWFAEYDKVRAEMAQKAIEREAKQAQRKAEHLALVGEWK